MLEYDDNEFVYRLVGICIHRGRANSGHYWSLIHVKRGAREPDPIAEEDKWHDLTTEWREVNDERTGFFYPSSISKEAYGGSSNDAEAIAYSGSGSIEDYSKSAYLLVYEKKLKSELRQVAQGVDAQPDTIEKV